MKATGIVRRIDDLGRVVIPKEIRRTMRIREGDPLEIYTEKDGELIFKKFSPIGELSDFASKICESLNKSTDAIVTICDRDTVISAAGSGKKELLGKRISPELEKIMEGRGLYNFQRGSALLPFVDNDNKYTIQIAAPILSEGDVLGALSFVSTNADPAGELEQKLAQTVSSFLGKQMES
ncbi:AbrB/MazE/SpoVT family DNA-binding domain-containing protein [Clostridiaceae bacterium OttesenSCG-928-D20]|nr:AbrB/MazE/SpoVT family DNA-binding domain-containing protein [Clostridiaceae bacterium OttesenSCG-928-D20]